jgi:small basic protein
MRTICLFIYLSSLSALAFEISLIRIFSIRLSYHYASVIVSISMLGLVLGGMRAYLRRAQFGARALTVSVFFPVRLVPACPYPAVGYPFRPLQDVV